VVLAMGPVTVADAIEKGKWIEVMCYGEEVQE
jgi:hypothetical protein